MSLYGDPDPNRYGYDKNGKKYYSWHNYWESKIAMDKREAEEKKFISSSSGDGDTDYTGVFCMAMIVGIGVLAIYASQGEGIGDIVEDVKNLPENIYDAVRGGIEDAVESIFISSDKENPTVIQHFFPYILEALEEDKPSNETSSIHFSNNKTLILFPDHALDAEKVMNPQWRLQLG